jgi:hypothetical protein
MIAVLVYSVWKLNLTGLELHRIVKDGRVDCHGPWRSEYQSNLADNMIELTEDLIEQPH